MGPSYPLGLFSGKESDVAGLSETVARRMGLDGETYSRAPLNPPASNRGKYPGQERDIGYICIIIKLLGCNKMYMCVEITTTIPSFLIRSMASIMRQRFRIFAKFGKRRRYKIKFNAKERESGH